MLIGLNDISLYVQNPENPVFTQHFASDLVHILPYESATTDIPAKCQNQKTWITDSLNYAISSKIGNKYTTSLSEVNLMKAVKNKVEIKNMLSANVKAALAISKYLAYIEQNYDQQDISEADGADILQKFYAEGDKYVSQSFGTISASTINGTLLHYKPKKGQDRKIETGVYLVDSGAQYWDGTTDTTRTVYLTRNKEENLAHFNHVKECYTRVLKGHIGICEQKFPEGTTGYQLDILSRKSLWDVGLDFLHGTGHGIGCFNAVHEGPRTWYISSKANTFSTSNDNQICGHSNQIYLKPNYICSNEPGYYEADGRLGIRLENAIVVVDADTAEKNLKFKENVHGKDLFAKQFYGFENLIWCPYSMDLVDVELLSQSEVEYMNFYNLKCRELLLPLVENDELTRNWILHNTTQL